MSALVAELAARLYIIIDIGYSNRQCLSSKCTDIYDNNNVERTVEKGDSERLDSWAN